MFNGNSGVPFTMNVEPSGTGNNNGMGGWGDGWWAIIIFAMIFGWGNGGWGGFGNGGGNGIQGALTRGDLCQDMNFNNLESAVRGVQQGLCDGFYAMNTSLLNGFHGVDNAVCTLGYQTQQGFNGVDNAICNLGYNIQQGQNAIQTQIADCCCQTQRAIDGVNYNMATNTCTITNQMNNNTRDIIDSQNAGTRAILDYLCQEKISDLQSENQSLRLAASQSAQNQYLVNQLRPCPQPAYLTCNPFTGQYGGYGYNNSCGCNNGCGCA